MPNPDLKPSKRSLLYLWLVSFGISFFLATFNNDPLPLLLTQKLYYRDVIVNTGVVRLVLQQVRLVTAWLEPRLPWRERAGLRLGAQAVLGFGGGALLSLFLAWFQWRFIDATHVFGFPGFWEVEYPVALLLVLIANGVFSLMYGQRPEVVERIVHVDAPAQAEPQFLMAEAGGRTVPIHVESVAALYLEHGLTRLATLTGERYTLEEPLSTVQESLPAAKFFRANRQTIVSAAACRDYASIGYGKIALRLHAPAGLEVVISQKTAPAFRQWMRELDVQEK